MEEKQKFLLNNFVNKNDLKSFKKLFINNQSQNLKNKNNLISEGLKNSKKLLNLQKNKKYFTENNCNMTYKEASLYKLDRYYHFNEPNMINYCMKGNYKWVNVKYNNIKKNLAKKNNIPLETFQFPKISEINEENCLDNGFKKNYIIKY